MTRVGQQDVAWITGASGGIGSAVARFFAATGYAVGLTARREDKLREIAKEIEAAGGRAVVAVGDLALEDGCVAAHRAVTNALDAPSLLINAAGISPWSTFTETSTSEFDETIAVNLRSMFLTSKLVLPAMYAAGRGTIVQVLSVASIKGYRNGMAYTASKFGARGFTQALREEARLHGVRVIGVLPGAVATELWDPALLEAKSDVMMSPEEIARLIVATVCEPSRTLVEEMIVRPLVGDI